jgi:type IV pilus assembly protein PilW
MRRESGFTIVELMVGMLIGLISIVVMFQVFAVSEGQRRTTVGAGDAQQNGVTSLYLMERDARMAGYGINYFRLLGCDVNGFWSPSASKIKFTLAPVVIQNGASGTAPDKITFVYGDTDTYTFPSVLSNDTTGAGADAGAIVIRDDRFPYKAGGLFIVGEIPDPKGAVPPYPNGMKPCSMFQVTKLDPNEKRQILITGAGYVDDTLVGRPANYVPPTAVVTTQLAPNDVYYKKWSKLGSWGGRVLNLGREPSVIEYSIVNNQLVSRNLLLPDQPATPISDGIVQLQAQYGYSGTDATGAGPCLPAPTVIVPCRIGPAAASVPQLDLTVAVDQWGDDFKPAVLPTTSQWRQIIAMRFIVVARSGQREKVNPATGACDTTKTMPVWSVNSKTIDLSADPDWRCYRYRTFETVVPIRNFMWFPDPNGTSEPPA